MNLADEDEHDLDQSSHGSVYDSADYMMYGDEMGTNEAKIDMLENIVNTLETRVKKLEQKQSGGKRTKKRKHHNKKRKTKAQRKRH